MIIEFELGYEICYILHCRKDIYIYTLLNDTLRNGRDEDWAEF